MIAGKSLDLAPSDGAIWDRWNGEPQLWFHRFDMYYRTMGPERTLEGAYNAWRQESPKRRAQRPPALWRTRMNEWRWTRRAEAWDAHQRAVRMRIEQEEREEMFRRHARQSVAMQSLAVRRLNMLQNLAQSDPAAFEDAMNASEARLFLRDGMEAERKARGVPDYLAVVANMSDQEVDELFGQIFGDVLDADTVDGEVREVPKLTGESEDE